MRTNIEIDDELMRQAMAATGTTTKKAAVEACMRKVIRLKAQEGILKWFGKVQWEGDLAVSREGRYLDWAQNHEAENETAEADSEAVPVAR
jgi:Arc/MetJ family transcription regulator